MTKTAALSSKFFQSKKGGNNGKRGLGKITQSVRKNAKKSVSSDRFSWYTFDINQKLKILRKWEADPIKSRNTVKRYKVF